MFLNLQVRFFLSILSGRCQLPPKRQMLEEIGKDIEEKQQRGWPKRYWHMLREDHKRYFDDLADCSGCKRPPLYIHKLLHFVEENASKKYRFEILDDENFRFDLVNQ